MCTADIEMVECAQCMVEMCASCATDSGDGFMYCNECIGEHM
jgi:hypothetical protein